MNSQTPSPRASPRSTPTAGWSCSSWWPPGWPFTTSRSTSSSLRPCPASPGGSAPSGRRSGSTPIHVKWGGCSLHDMIQPSFSFLVGVALPFSLASRQAKGQGFWRMLFHAVLGRCCSIALGVFLRSTHANRRTSRSRTRSRRSGWGTCSCFCSASCGRPGSWTAFALDRGGLLGGVRPVPAAGRGLQLPGRRGAGRLAAPLPGVHGPLEQEQQPGLAVRRLVPEPVRGGTSRSSTTAAGTPP